MGDIGVGWGIYGGDQDLNIQYNYEYLNIIENLMLGIVDIIA